MIATTSKKVRVLVSQVIYFSVARAFVTGITEGEDVRWEHVWREWCRFVDVECGNMSVTWQNWRYLTSLIIQVDWLIDWWCQPESITDCFHPSLIHHQATEGIDADTGMQSVNLVLKYKCMYLRKTDKTDASIKIDLVTRKNSTAFA